MEKQFLNELVNSILHCLLSILKFLFVLPFEIWTKSVLKMSEQRKNQTLSMSHINSLWPFLSYIKRFVFDFLFDALIVLSYVLAVFVALYSWIDSGEFIAFFITLITVYFVPLQIAITRDILQLVLIPIRKFLSWGSKPAQFMNLEVKNDK